MHKKKKKASKETSGKVNELHPKRMHIAYAEDMDDPERRDAQDLD